MRVSRKWIEWAHVPPAESGVEASLRLCELADAPGRGAVEVTDLDLVRELVDVAETYCRPARGDALWDMGPWWCAQPRKVIDEGRRVLRLASQTHPG